MEGPRFSDILLACDVDVDLFGDATEEIDQLWRHSSDETWRKIRLRFDQSFAMFYLAVLLTGKVQLPF